jgi:hypothetical protein
VDIWQVSELASFDHPFKQFVRRVCTPDGLPLSLKHTSTASSQAMRNMRKTIKAKIVGD